MWRLILGNGGERKGHERLHISPFLAETRVISAATARRNRLGAGQTSLENWKSSTGGGAGAGGEGEGGLRGRDREDESNWGDGEMHVG